jgi:hypothetical protein
MVMYQRHFGIIAGGRCCATPNPASIGLAADVGRSSLTPT